MRPEHADRLWAADPAEKDTDPANVQHGAAGTLAVLTRAAATLPRAARPDGLLAGVAAAAGWLDRRLPAESHLLPGLYFGRSGAAWALYEAGRLLADDWLTARAVDLAARLPARWPNPDVCHGTAGAGLACLALWRATGDERLDRQVRACADHLVATVGSRNGEVCWSIPADFDSALAGMTHYGFAHGVAGIGAFLLAAGQATGRGRYLELADAAGATLRRVAHRPGYAAWWPVGEEADPTRPIRMAHWCSGSSGVGTFLLRLWQHDGDPAHRELAEAAAGAVRRVRWQVSTTACHGLPGDGQFLLDLAQALGEPRYHGWAAELAACLHAYAVERNGRLVVPGEGLQTVHAGYHTGLAGVLDFLLRLRHGGNRPWLVEPLAAAAGRSGGLR
jgi:lantibiotic modifying enzyme